MQLRLRKFFLFSLLVAAGCTTRAAGGEGAECYPNRTCNAGLICLSNLCVNPSTTDGGQTDGSADSRSLADSATSMDASRYDDGGLPCPGANIFHPSSGQTRNVGAAVPFVGRARDAMCATITNLVWTDSLEGQIGTGETFNYSFTQSGMHTITLVATDSLGNRYTAMITLMLI